MKIKSKPKFPKRDTRKYTVSAYSMTLNEILNQCRAILGGYEYTEQEARDAVGYDDISVDTQWDYDSDEVVAVFTIPISIKEYDRIKQKYETKLQAYNDWLVLNKTEIEAELIRREQESQEAEAIRLQAEIDRLSEALSKNHNKLKALTD